MPAGGGGRLRPRRGRSCLMGRSRNRVGPGTTVLVTGASSGIGQVIATELARAGCQVVLAARRADRIAAMAAEIGPAALAWPIDLRDTRAIALLPDALPERFRAIDILVNNAGSDVGGRLPFTERPADAWDGMIDTNLRAVFGMTRAVLPGMIGRKRGDIVNVGSISGIRSYANVTAYGATKAAIHMFSENLRSELEGSGVRVIEMLPGPVRTEFMDVRFGGDQERIERYWKELSESAPLEAEDVARCVLFALSQPAHVTLSQIVIMPSARC